MKELRCKKCEYHFCSENGIPYCPACGCEDLEEIYEKVNTDVDEEMENHHIHPRFMDNEGGEGQQFSMPKKNHSILHGKIMIWIWKEIPKNLRKKIVKIIITKSKEFIGTK